MSHHRLLALTLLASLALPSMIHADDSPPADKPAQSQPQPGAQGTAFADFDKDGFLDVFITGATLGQPQAPSQPQQLSEYWIGIDGTAPDDALRAQLELPAGQGLLINQVVDASPAAKAGLKQYDVVLTCNDAPLAQIPDLAKIIEEKKDATLALRLIRNGKRIIIEVTPERRPASQTGVTCPAVSKATDEEFARRVWLDLTGTLPDAAEIQGFIAEKREKKRDWLVNRLLRRSTVANKSCTACHANDGDSARLYTDLVDLAGDVLWTQNLRSTIAFDAMRGHRLLALPNTILQLQPQVLTNLGAHELADDVTVSISRKGKEAARITVRKGDHIWEFSEQDGQEKVPEEARTLVKPFLSSLVSTLGAYVNDYIVTRSPHALYWNNNNGTFVDVTNGLNLNLTGAANPTTADQAKAAAESRPAASDAAIEQLDKQIESLNTQLAELRRAMQDLRQSMKPAPAKEK